MIGTRRDESGQALLIVVGFTLVAFAVAGIAVDGARLFILRGGLQNTADAAATAGAAQLDVAALYSGGGTPRLDPDAAAAKAETLLAERGLAMTAEVTVEDDLVHAVVRARLKTTLLALVGVKELRVAADATATPVFGEAP